MVLTFEPLSLHTMLKPRIISRIKKASCFKTIVLGLLVTCLLLSNCTVRKSIEAFLNGSVRTESGMGNGFKKIRPIADNVQVGNPLLCSVSDQGVFLNADFQGTKTLGSLLPQMLFLTVLLGFVGSALLAQSHNINSISFSKASFAFSSAPIYIKNRLLLI